MHVHADDKLVKEINCYRIRSDDFETVKTIGRGAFGEVRLVCAALFYNGSLLHIMHKLC